MRNLLKGVLIMMTSLVVFLGINNVSALEVSLNDNTYTLPDLPSESSNYDCMLAYHSFNQNPPRFLLICKLKNDVKVTVKLPAANSSSGMSTLSTNYSYDENVGLDYPLTQYTTHDGDESWSEPFNSGYSSSSLYYNDLIYSEFDIYDKDNLSSIVYGAGYPNVIENNNNENNNNDNNEENTFSVSSIFTETGTVMSGFVTLSTNFVGSLWENPIGRIAIIIPFVGAAIGLGYKLFLRKKRVK